LEKTPPCLDALFTRCQNGEQQPTTDALADTLREILGSFQQAFVILDALDECMEREELLELIETILAWKIENLHILATSRNEKDINDFLESLVTGQISIEGASVDADIRTHIREQLKKDSKLRKWPANIQTEIEETLMKGAAGMQVIIPSIIL
jgi:osmotically-inducible protein OsmY